MDVVKKYSCPVCFEIFQRPASIPCGHIYCINCLTAYITESSGGGKALTCAVCRKMFDKSGIRIAHDVETAMATEVVNCADCHSEMLLTAYNSHVKMCRVRRPVDVTFRPIAFSSQPPPKDLPNRSTFNCPLCSARNMDCVGLVKHSLTHHRYEKVSVKPVSSTKLFKSLPSVQISGRTARPITCPICASMPWGNPYQRSGDYIAHLSLRHQFEYDTYVDYEQDDESALREAIEASLKTV